MSGVISEGEGHEFENAVPQKALEAEEKIKPPIPIKPPLKPPLKPSLSTPEVPPPCEKAVNDSQEKKEKGQEKDKEKEKGKEAKKKKEKKRKIVFVAYKINCISNIDSILCTYEVDAKIFYFWDDEKVVGRPKGTSLKLEDEPELFNPDIVVTNGHNLDIQSVDVKVTDAKKGSVKMSIHIKGECFLTAMELHLFPFDCQNLLITLKPYKLPYEEVILISKPEEECAMDNNVTQEWDVFGHCTISTTTDPATSSTNKAYSSLSVAVLVTRRPGWFINNVFFVSLLLLFVSWSTFAMYRSYYTVYIVLLRLPSH